MSFQVEAWLELLTKKMKSVFADRILFLGLQGSYRRGEATQNSDIDIVLILDVLNFSDLCKYKALLAEMPFSEKACGFICGKDELWNWPKYDLFQLVHDTCALIGEASNLFPQLTPTDAQEAVRVGTANLYHEVCHSYLYGKTEAENLAGAYKTAFFVLRTVSFLRTGSMPPTKQALLSLLEEKEREILQICMNWEAFAQQRKEHPEFFFELLLDWCGKVLAEQNR